MIWINPCDLRLLTQSWNASFDCEWNRFRVWLWSFSFSDCIPSPVLRLSRICLLLMNLLVSAYSYKPPLSITTLPVLNIFFALVKNTVPFFRQISNLAQSGSVEIFWKDLCNDTKIAKNFLQFLLIEDFIRTSQYSSRKYLWTTAICFHQVPYRDSAESPMSYGTYELKTNGNVWKIFADDVFNTVSRQSFFVTLTFISQFSLFDNWFKNINLLKWYAKIANVHRITIDVKSSNNWSTLSEALLLK